MMKIIIIVLSTCAFVSMFDIVFEKTEMIYINTKFFNLFNFTLRKSSRKTPYILNLYQNFKTAIGNNLTIKVALYEIIAGREILTPVQYQYPLCDAFQKDKYIGKLFADQLPKGWRCPFPAGYNNWTNIAIRFEHLPYLPFTYSSLIVRASVTFNGYINNELSHTAKVYGVIKQKMEDLNPKKKNIITNINN